MTRERFEEIMDGDSKLGDYDDDNAFLGLQIIRKYIPKKGIEGAEHNIIYSIDVDRLLEAGIAEEDAIELRNLNWMIDEDGDCLACFV
jgi:hypothetical protein